MNESKSLAFMFWEKRQSKCRTAFLPYWGGEGKYITEHYLPLLQPQNSYSVKSSSWLLESFQDGVILGTGDRREYSNGETPLKSQNQLLLLDNNFSLPSPPPFPSFSFMAATSQSLLEFSWSEACIPLSPSNAEIQVWLLKALPINNRDKNNGYKQRGRRLHHLDNKLGEM